MMTRWASLFSLFLILLGVSASGLDNVEANFLSLINQYRSQSPECFDSLSDSWMAWPAASVRNLTEATALSSASRGHNQAMIAGNCFSHQCPGEAPFDVRAQNAGYAGFSYLAENIAAGYENAEGAFNGWRNSVGHNQNMLSCRVFAIGIARDASPGGTDFPYYWTTVFGDVIQLGGVAPAPLPLPQPQPQPQPPSSPAGSAQAYDFNQNCLIENAEFFSAVDDWIFDVIDNATFFQIVDAWISGSRIC